jgi:ketosteroid isomerase-like protein
MKINPNEMPADRMSGPARLNPAGNTPFRGQPNPSQAKTVTASTKNVIDHHLRSFGECDLAGILSDYAPDAVFFTANGTLRGVDEIKPLFQAMLAEFEKPGAAFQMKQQFIEGDHAYILWNAETADNVYELGTDTFVVKNGRIVAQSYTGKITPKA